MSRRLEVGGSPEGKMGGRRSGPSNDESTSQKISPIPPQSWGGGSGLRAHG